MRVLDAGLVAVGAVVVWLALFRCPETMSILEHKRVRFLVSRHVCGSGVERSALSILGAEFVDAPEEAAFRGWVLQEASVFVRPEAKTATAVGVGAGTVVKLLSKRGLDVTGVDRHCGVVAMARREFHVTSRLVCGDGLATLEAMEPVDVVLIDVYDGGSSASSWTFLDALDAIKKRTLMLLVYNVVLLDDDVDRAGAVRRRLLGTFKYARGFRDNPGGSSASNVVFFASDEPLDPLFRRTPPDGKPGSPDWVIARFSAWEVEYGNGNARRDAHYDATAAATIRNITKAYLPDQPRDAPSAAVLFTLLAFCYLAWMRFSDDAKSQADEWGPRRLALALFHINTRLGRMVGVTWGLVLDDVVRRKIKNGAITCVSPHGAYPVGAVLLGMPYFRCFESNIFFGAASILFYVPGLREYLLLMNAREITRATMRRLLDAGRAIGVNPGGIHEMIHQASDKETVYVHPNLGLFRLAIEKKKPVVCMYGFGENQLYTCHPERFLWARRKLAKLAKVGVPWISGRFGVGFGPLPLLPHPVCITHVADSRSVIDVSGNDAEALFRTYQSTLTALFDRHKFRYLPRHVADKGLHIVRIGAK